ncbi:MAG: TRAP transporter small permease [Burkholderiaceae bacterium]|nr:TRAP transporter small permease [Burkholderiaceae bacterium]
MDSIRQVLDVLRRVEQFVAVAAYVTVAALLLADVGAREFFASSILGAQKFAVLCTVVASFVGFALVTHDNAHLRVEIADALVPPALRGLHSRLGDVISFVLLATLTGITLRFVSETYAIKDQVAVLYIPMWPWQSVLAWGFGSSALRHAVYAIHPALKPVRDVGH